MSNMVSLVTLGCAKNLVDSEYLVTGLKHVGYKINDNIDKSDIVIINTCGFLDVAREESINKIIEILHLFVFITSFVVNKVFGFKTLINLSFLYVFFNRLVIFFIFPFLFKFTYIVLRIPLNIGDKCGVKVNSTFLFVCSSNSCWISEL